MDKKFYWIKLRTDFFNREDIDFLLSQENGCQYVVLYQMLCLNTANTNGKLQSQMNEVIVPYDIKKIVRDTKYFDSDTIIVALELYKKLGLIYEEQDKILKISNIEAMVGSESANKDAIKKRNQRLKKKIEQGTRLETKEGTNCLIENRDKRLDIRDIDNNIKENIIKEKFIKPTLKDVETYCQERNNNVNAQRFIDFYESKGWMVGKNKMKDWKACVRTWEHNRTNNKEQLPSWFNKDIKREEISEKDKEEFENIINEFN